MAFGKSASQPVSPSGVRDFNVTCKVAVTQAFDP